MSTRPFDPGPTGRAGAGKLRTGIRGAGRTPRTPDFGLLFLWQGWGSKTAYRLATGVSRLDFMPERDIMFPIFPTQIYFMTVFQGQEIQ